MKDDYTAWTAVRSASSAGSLNLELSSRDCPSRQHVREAQCGLGRQSWLAEVSNRSGLMLSQFAVLAAYEY